MNMDDIYIGLRAMAPKYYLKVKPMPWDDCELCGGTGTISNDADPDNDQDCTCLDERNNPDYGTEM